MILGAISCHLEPTEIYRHKAEGISLRYSARLAVKKMTFNRQGR